MKYLRAFVIILTGFGLIWCLLDPPVRNMQQIMMGQPTVYYVEIKVPYLVCRLISILIAGAVGWYLTRPSPAVPLPEPKEKMMRLVPRDEEEQPALFEDED